MKPGIKKIQYILASSVEDFGQLPPGTVIPSGAYFRASALSDLPFIQETADYREQWNYDGNGRYSDFSFSAATRADKEALRPVFRKLAGRRFLFVITTVSGESFVIGSPSAPPTFTYTDGISGISDTGFTFNISLKSLQGIVRLSQ